MTREEVISRFCALAGHVGSKLGMRFAHDCFCGENPMSGKDSMGGFQFNKEVMEFIEQSVRDAILAADNNRRNSNHPHSVKGPEVKTPEVSSEWTCKKCMEANEFGDLGCESCLARDRE